MSETTKPAVLNPDELYRLACLLDNDQLSSLLAAVSAVVVSGSGYGSVEIAFVAGSAHEFKSSFTVRPTKPG